jgi:preprotein translocase subunit SecB
MIIEQDRNQLQNAIYLHSRAEIKSLRLAWSRIESQSIVRASSTEGLSLEIDFKPAAFRVGPEGLTLDTDFKFAIAREGQKDNPVVLIECRFEGQYALVPEYIPSEEQIEAFRTANAVFNCWPFFREYVQNTTVRLGFPPPPIPFLRMTQKQVVETPESELPAAVPTSKVRTTRTKRKRVNVQTVTKRG